MKLAGRFVIALITALMLCVGAYFALDYFIKANNQTVRVLVSKQEIPPRTLITEDMFRQDFITAMEMPKKLVPENILVNPKDILGKYTTTNYTVPANGFFHKGKMLTAREIKDGAALLLKPGEKMISIDVNLKSSIAAQIVEGSYIQPWVAAEGKEDRRPVVGPFWSGIRVLGTYSTTSKKAAPTTGVTSAPQSGSQANVNGDQKQGQQFGTNIVPQTIVLAVNDQQAFFIQLAQQLGEINVIGLGGSPDTYKDVQQQQGQVWTIAHTQKWMMEQMSAGFSGNGQPTAKK